MDSLDDPETFENSSIVEKSSQTGIFSNQRLLVIKNGFLYYFSKVPKGYKSHIPNVLDSFKELPKCSIEIKAIEEIKLESAKSSSLMIKFYTKDMIDKQDIRKSIDSHTYSAPQKKNTKDTDEWKFTFTTVLQCRLWYNALIKLKDHFKKQQNSFNKFITNFAVGLSKNETKERSVSEIKQPLIEGKPQPRKTEPIKFDLTKFIVPDQKDSKQQQTLPKDSPKHQENRIQRSPSEVVNSLKSQEENSQNEKIGLAKQQTDQKDKPIVPLTQKTKEDQQFVSNDSATLNKDNSNSKVYETIHEDQELRIKQIEDEIREELEVEIRKEIELKSKSQIAKYKAEMMQKEQRIKKLESQMFKNQILNQQRQKQIEDEKKKLEKKIQIEQEKSDRLKREFEQSYISNTSELPLESNQKNSGEDRSEIQPQKQEAVTKVDINQETTLNEQNLHEESSYHQFQPQLNDSKDLNSSRELNLSKELKIRSSFFSDYNMTSNRNTLTVRSSVEELKNSVEFSNQAAIDEKFRAYNYFEEQARIFESGIGSEEKIKRETTFLKYVSHMRRKAEVSIKEYINEFNPSGQIEVQRGNFIFDIVSVTGKIININGSKKLAYSNKLHTKLKRSFKVYQKLQNEIIRALKKKPQFPLRVPLCYLIEYRGYTVLAKIQHCTKNEQTSVMKHFRQILSQNLHSYFDTSQMINSANKLLLIRLKKNLQEVFKVTDTDSTSLCFDGVFDLGGVVKSRKANISINSQKFAQEIEGKDNEVNLKLLKYINFFRELKKVYKTQEAFSQSLETKSNFVEQLLKEPETILELVSEEAKSEIQVPYNGLFFYFLDFFLGIKLHQIYSAENEDHAYHISMVSRQFEIQNLNSSLLSNKIDSYLSQQNFDAARTCIDILDSTCFDRSVPQIYEVRLLMQQKRYAEAEEKIMILRETQLQLHDFRNIELNTFLIECYLFMGLETEALKQIRNSLQYIEYMFGNCETSDQPGGFSTRNTLLLLMAETLLKMGHFQQAVKVYHGLMESHSIDKETIFVSFSQLLDSGKTEVSDEESIELLKTFVTDVKGVENQIKLNLSLAKLYRKVGRMDKSVFYFEQVFSKSLEYYGPSKNVNLLSMYSEVLQSCSSLSSMEEYYKQLCNHSCFEGYFEAHQGWKVCLNTINASNICSLLLKKQSSGEQLLSNLRQTKIFPDEGKISIRGWENIVESLTVLIQKEWPKQTKVRELLESVSVEGLLKSLEQNI